MIELGSILLLLVIGYVFGTLAEKRHFRSLRERESQSQGLPVLATDIVDPSQQVEQAYLVVGTTVVAIDYFKAFAAGLRSFFGGRVRVYETLLDRARRESILRMKAEASGCDLIINVRVETSSIGGEHQGKNKIHSVECYAYGTAIRYARH
jgi:uncharacterized protein YbjQ (UPF0145 family)